MNKKDPLPGGGPWRILPECPSPAIHNTEYAAYRQVRRHRCICPRGRAAKRARDDKRVDRRRQTIKPMPSAKLAVPREHSVSPPDMTDGLCRSPEYDHVVDRSFAVEATRGAMRARKEMKDLCSFCPLVRQCAEFVLEAEDPPASWGGVYGGLDVWNRRGQELFIADGAVNRRAFDAQSYLNKLV